MTLEGFKGQCSDFFVRNPGYFLKPVRVNGSVVESLFGRFKYNADGHLSAVNYRGCVARLIVSDAVNKSKYTRSMHDIVTHYNCISTTLHELSLLLLLSFCSMWF